MGSRSGATVNIWPIQLVTSVETINEVYGSNSKPGYLRPKRVHKCISSIQNSDYHKKPCMLAALKVNLSRCFFLVT